MCACLLTIGFTDYKKHSGIISKFRELLIKPNIFTPDLSKIIGKLEEYRNNSDYMKGVRASKVEAEECSDKAKEFYEAVKKYTDDWLKQSGVS